MPPPMMIADLIFDRCDDTDAGTDPAGEDRPVGAGVDRRRRAQALVGAEPDELAD